LFIYQAEETGPLNPEEEFMVRKRLVVGAFAVTLAVAGGSPLEAQRTQENLPLTPLAPAGDFVAPFFDGWYLNPDGSHTLSFGFFNRNTQEIVEVPIGPDNFIEPAQFNGVQPTHFPPVSYGGFSGRRERGAFAVTIPAGYTGPDVVWTIRSAGKTLSVPGRPTSGSYQLSYTPQAAGSLMPLVKVDPNGEAVFGREGVRMRLTAKAGEPVTLWVWGEDRGDRGERTEVNATWIKHQGPGDITFEPETLRTPIPGGELTTSAVFSSPGQYVVRVRVDNFTTSDSSFADQCCWSNGYYEVTVTE